MCMMRMTPRRMPMLALLLFLAGPISLRAEEGGLRGAVQKAEVASAGASCDDLEVTVWAEHPEIGAPLATLKDYFVKLRSFLKDRSIRRLLFRVQDPSTNDIYQLPSATVPRCIDPSYGICSTKPNMLCRDSSECDQGATCGDWGILMRNSSLGQQVRNGCCTSAPECVGGGAECWCRGYTKQGVPDPAVKFHTCHGCGDAVVPCGDDVDTRGLFFTELLLHPDVSASIYVVPWLPEPSPQCNGTGVAWQYPTTQQCGKTVDNNIQKAACWIGLANKYAAKVGRAISGIVYEKEAACPWSDSLTALPELVKALIAFVPTFSNDAHSSFALTSASQNNMCTWMDCSQPAPADAPYLHAIFPQFYNLCGGVDCSILDATSDLKIISRPNGAYEPRFPKTAYTECDLQSFDVSLSSDSLPLCALTSLSYKVQTSQNKILRPADVHYMLSSELAPASVDGVLNTYHDRDCTITGAGVNTGSINAFGSPQWKNWDDVTRLMKTWCQTYSSSHLTVNKFAVFQFNMFPPSWDMAGAGPDGCSVHYSV